MNNAMKPLIGKALAVTGPVEPSALGTVMMHEHLHSDNYDWVKDAPIDEETPTSPARRQFLLDDAVPLLREARERHGLGAYCDVTMPPWRAWPDVYTDVSRASGVAIILATGYYREIELGQYWAKTPDRQIWSFVHNSSVEQLAGMCVREITEGIHGTGIRAGLIKLGTSQPEMTEAEIKTFRAGARAQRETGVHITTHCTKGGSESSQLTLLEKEGVDLRRVVIGHMGWLLTYPEGRKLMLDWMKRGANFLPTNLDVTKPEDWCSFVEGIHGVFDAGHGDKLVLGLDHGYCAESGKFERVQFMPQPPWLYMFDHVLPAFRKLGLTADEEDWIMRRNPQRIVPVQTT